jgi:ABC-type Fe2+-enterobactin transport system substrate-binding protein
VYTSKDRVRVVIVVLGWRVAGDIHVLVGSRLTDALNSKTHDFFAITNAKIMAMESDEVLYDVPYMAVNRASISCIFPLDEG